MARKTASGSEPPRSIEIAGNVVRPGRRSRFEVPVAKLPVGSGMAMQVAVVNGRRPGPVVWLSGAIHGDEIIGVEIIRDVLGALDPRQLSGAVIAVPVVNIFGFLSGSRYLPDRRDLNRSFPGSKRGSMAARLAKIFMDTVVASCDLGIDYHTASDHRDNWPQIRADLQNERTRELAATFGAPAMLQAKTRDGSLREAATRKGIQVLLFEGGEPLRFDEAVTKIGVDGTLRVMRHLGMIEAPDLPKGRRSIEINSSQWMRARRGGILRLRVGLGESVESGQTLGDISDAFGTRPMLVKANATGRVIALTRRPLVNQGDAVVHIGVERGR